MPQNKAHQASTFYHSIKYIVSFVFCMQDSLLAIEDYDKK